MLLTLAEYRRVFIVDAASVGRAPGEWMRIALDLHRLGVETPALSCHAAGLADALALGAALDVLPEQVIIFGVQPARVDWSPGLSAEVWKAVPAVGRAILSEIAPVGKPSRGGSLRSTP
jgi:hydrogenase maturation protease